MKKFFKTLLTFTLCINCITCTACNPGSFSSNKSSASETVKETQKNSSETSARTSSTEETLIGGQGTSNSEKENDSQKETVKSETENDNRQEKENDSQQETVKSEAADKAETESGQASPLFTEIDHYVLTPADKYYLTDEKMDGYRKALDAVFAHESQVQLTDSFDDNLSILWYLQESPYSFVLSSYDLTDDHKSAWFEYKYSEQECKEMMDFIDQEYLAILNENITSDMTDLEKVLSIYKYFTNRISYDYDWLDELNMSDEQYLFPDIVIYQALKTNKGVCHTYTYLCQFAFQQLGIDCVRGSADMQDGSGGHMWPIVWLDGKTFHIDPTWDDGGDTTSLRYFGMTDTENCNRGLVENWSCTIDSALDCTCTDERFSSWRDITDYELIGSHQMKVIREDGTSEVINLLKWE